MKRFLSLLLVALLLLPCLLTGCKDKNAEETTLENNTPAITTPTQTTPEATTPGEVEELPEGHIKLETVSLLAGDTPAEQTAVAELKAYLMKKGVAVEDFGGFPITITLDEELGNDAFRVTATVGENKDESLLIEGGNGRGVLYGVYRFLEEYADVRYFTPELEVCEEGLVSFPDGVLIDYTPVFELRQTDWYRWMSDAEGFEFSVKSGINLISGWTPTWGEEFGGSLSYAPSMFVHTIGKLAELDTPYPATAPNPCLTDETVYQTVLKNVLAVLEANPDARILSVSQNDNEKHCSCDSCKAIEAEEGSASGPLLRFVNRIANAIAEDYPNVTIDTLAYKYTQKAPKVTKPAPNVCIRLCTITCHFNHPITSTSCKTCQSFCNDIVAWSEICDNIYIWDYTTNYSYYLASFPNFHVLRENMKFFAENHVKGVFEQGNSSGPSGEFGELRAYLIAKLLMNPYMTKAEYENHMNEFLKAYYGAGWENILKYINSFKMYATTSTDGMGIYTSPLTVISKQALANMKDNYNAWWDAAEAAAGDRLEYVQRSRLQLRYLLLFLEPNKEEAMQFVKTVEDNKIHWREGQAKLLWYVYEDDNALLGQAPDKWFK